MINKNNIVGLVLCGGQSTRMGSDKGMLKKGELTWAQIAREKLLALNIPAVVSVNNDQVEEYEHIFSISELVIDDEFEVGGPLLGLLSAHHMFPGKDIFILACDMVEMQVEVLENLIANYSAPATVFKNEYFAEPLCGIYSNEALEKIFVAYKDHELRSHSMMTILNLISANTIEINKSWQQFFNNINTPVEAKGIRN
ncbi:MAG: molybdenum cofactor guanylyltransferase [Bacteroidetes bacterium]|nr:molybdenum cofactor guanylyltransferase [Bacteroidota bacterium]